MRLYFVPFHSQHWMDFGSLRFDEQTYFRTESKCIEVFGGVTKLLFGFFFGYKGFCHRAVSNVFFFPWITVSTTQSVLSHISK